ncbi:MAG: RecQ family ATP-dependent DNA helicase [Desulfopila sp.]
MEDCHDFLAHCLLLDIEVNERGVIYAVGAVYGEKTFQSASGEKLSRGRLAELDAFAENAGYLLGHNIIGHDIPRLAKLAPSLQLLGKPVIDTLYLSPLAYPANPYHRLVKDYQIVRDSINDPVKDAVLAGKIFTEQRQAFTAQLRSGSELPVLARSFLHQAEKLRGCANALGQAGIPLLEGEDLHDSFAWFAEKHGCVHAARKLVERFSRGQVVPAVLAYTTAWLSVAGGNSVLPPWVRHAFPEISRILHMLRDNDCGDYHHCPYCAQHHDAGVFLRDFFGFQSFRAEPATPEGASLQQEVVAAAANNATLFSTLPTGGGKSLCYLLPALMRYLRRNLLTIVISPLQALMKDQVDNFSRQSGTGIAAALYGMLTMVERREVMDAIRLGDVGILYVSPEQLRNHSFVQVIGQREIGAWVFDEAHCLSKWGHDFRPDYLYAIRFIREFAGREGVRIPPVQCFTATAKKDVKAEIVDVIQSELGLRVSQFTGGHERNNLHYDVYPVDKYDKQEVIAELLHQRYTGSGSVVIYCATRKNTEKLAEFLENRGYAADAFHAGLDTPLKKRLQESFLQGETPIICATNAFGMGIDKDDVRLVIHADIPGSLENYLQEAGRAGRDHDNAECILVFEEQDVEKQFQLGSSSRLTMREIGQMLRGIRYAAKGEEEVVLTPGELLRQDVVDMDPAVLYDPASKVRTAVAWLERAGFIERNENNTRVFQGKPLVRDLQEAEEKIGIMNLSARQRRRWMAILEALMAQQHTDVFSADDLAGLPAFAAAKEDGPHQSETQRVVTTLHDMAEQGVLSKETTMSAYIRYKVANNGKSQLQRVCELEKDFIDMLERQAPGADLDSALELDLRQVNQQLLDMGHGYSSPEGLKRILHGLSKDGKGLAAQGGSLTIRTRGRNCFSIYLHRDWESLKTTMKIRQQAAAVALQAVHAAVDCHEKPNANLLVEFTLEQVVAALQGDLGLLPLLKKPLAVAERALSFMHEQQIIDLQQGLAVFSQAMTMRLHPEARGRRYTRADFTPLQTHYTERNFQIHVMNEYARQALTKISTAMRLIASYFNDDKEDFVQRYFPDRKKMLERATSEQSYQRIVDDLKNDCQQAIVAAPPDKNMLVLAGPGAGKTRVVTHRVAYLLKVERVAPDAILVLCFNRGAVLDLRRKLRQLAGAEMGRVTALTFHGLALRLTGRSLAAVQGGKRDRQVDFDQVIDEAVSLLKGEAEVVGVPGEVCRDVLVGRFSHILVDEYQDIDAGQYELVSLLAGKALAERDQKMAIMAVGDDDQNIYRFRGANVGFIRRFRADYGAEVHYLVENYRSTTHIIDAANALIRLNIDRMKTDHAITINTARRNLSAGGNREITDPVACGRVQRIEVEDEIEQSRALVAEVLRLRQLEEGLDINSCAILAREWKDLDMIRSQCEAHSIPVNFHWGRTGGFPSLARIRENAEILEYLDEHRQDLLCAGDLLSRLGQASAGDTIWQDNLRRLLLEWQEETHDSKQPVSMIMEYLYESFADQRRSRNLGNGLFLSTIHSVKGLEFDHVFILAQSWQDTSGSAMEEERRLYYVGMSRARQTLQLFSLQSTPNPHASVLSGDFLVTRRQPVVGETAETQRRYALLGMEDLFIDYAGIRRENDPVRRVAASLNCGDNLCMVFQDDRCQLITEGGVPVACLSQKARKRWKARLDMIVEITIVAMVTRHRDDIADIAFKKRCHGERWEVPVVEISYTSMAG